MKTWHWILLGLVFLGSLAAGFLGEEGHGPWAHVPGFWGAFGFAGCVLIIVISKAIGKRLLARREDYYDDAS